MKHVILHSYFMLFLNCFDLISEEKLCALFSGSHKHCSFMRFSKLWTPEVCLNHAPGPETLTYVNAPSLTLNTSGGSSSVGWHIPLLSILGLE